MNEVAKGIEIPTLDETAVTGTPLLSSAQLLPFLGGVKVRVTARLGEAELSVQELSDLRAGSTVTLDRLVDQPVDLIVEGHVVAQGTLVAAGDHFGVRITHAPKAA